MAILAFVLTILPAVLAAGEPEVKNFSPVTTTCVQFFLIVGNKDSPYKKKALVVLYQSDGTIVSSVTVDMNGNQEYQLAFVYPTVGSYYAKIFDDKNHRWHKQIDYE